MPATDQDLIQEFVAGDPASFEELMRRHEQRIYNLALRMLGRPEDARDATQEAFFTALRKLPSFRGDSAFSTWLHRVAVNACYDILRKRQRRKEDELPEEAGPLPDDIADRTAGKIDVQRALSQVDETFRVVLILHDVQDLAYEDIAKVLDVPVGTVKSRLHRGRAALGRLLGGTATAASASEEKMEP